MIRGHIVRPTSAPSTPLARGEHPLARRWQVLTDRHRLDDCETCLLRAPCAARTRAGLSFADPTCEAAIRDYEPPVPLPPEQQKMRLLADKNRARVYATLRLRGPASVNELAETLEYCTTTIRSHLRRLADAGLVRVVELRPCGRGLRRLEEVFEVIQA